MPTGFLSDAERARLDGFPAQVLPGDIETHFTLSRADRWQVPATASPANRLGFALQLGALRFLGFCPDDLCAAPEAVVAFVARQLDVAPGELARYGRLVKTVFVLRYLESGDYRRRILGQLNKGEAHLRLGGKPFPKEISHSSREFAREMRMTKGLSPGGRDAARGMRDGRPIENVRALARTRGEREGYVKVGNIG